MSKETIVDIDGKLAKVRRVEIGPFAGRRIAECGQLFALKGKKFITTKRRANGLEYFSIGLKGKTIDIDVHILVAAAFLPENSELPYVLFKDGDIKNVHYTNLLRSEHQEIEPEKFKTIPGFSNYKVARKGGIVQSYFTKIPIVMKHHVSERGYHSVKMTNDEGEAVNMYVQRLVALTYLENPFNHPEVDHIHGDKSNHDVENLRWVSRAENSANRDTSKVKYYHSKKIEKCDPDGNVICTYNTINDAEKDTGCDCISSLARQNKNLDIPICHEGFIWRYSELGKEPYKLVDGEISLELIHLQDDINHPGYYITNFGNVINPDGHLVSTGNRVCPNIAISQSQYQVHILVATFFVPGKTDDKWMVDHINEDRGYCHYTNLEWVTPAENNRRAAHKRWKSVHKIDINTGDIIATYESFISAAKSISDGSNVDNIVSGISKACKGIQKSCRGFKWKYVNTDGQFKDAI